MEVISCLSLNKVNLSIICNKYDLSMGIGNVANGRKGYAWLLLDHKLNLTSGHRGSSLSARIVVVYYFPEIIHFSEKPPIYNM